VDGGPINQEPMRLTNWKAQPTQIVGEEAGVFSVRESLPTCAYSRPTGSRNQSLLVADLLTPGAVGFATVAAEAETVTAHARYCQEAGEERFASKSATTIRLAGLDYVLVGAFGASVVNVAAIGVLSHIATDQRVSARVRTAAHVELGWMVPGMATLYPSGVFALANISACMIADVFEGGGRSGLPAAVFCHLTEPPWNDW
jgi:hypothetical protein